MKVVKILFVVCFNSYIKGTLAIESLASHLLDKKVFWQIQVHYNKDINYQLTLFYYVFSYK